MTNQKISAIPSHWRWVRLGDVARYINGMAFKPDDWSPSGKPIIRIQNLNSPDASFNYFDGNTDERYKVVNGDLLISWSASLDAYIWKGEPALLNQHIFKVVENKDIVIREYLYFAVRGVMDTIRSQVHGATMRHITRPEFENIQIPLPPISDQQYIVAKLNIQLAAAERARTATTTQLLTVEKLSTVYLQKAFEYCDSSNTRQELLGDICDLLPAKSIATDGDVTVRAITTGCLTETGFSITGLKTARMYAKDAAVSIVTPGEILIARSNTPELVGRVAMYPGGLEDIVASDLTIRLKCKGQVIPSYLSKYLSRLYINGYWKERAGGASGSMKKITRTQIQALKIATPPLELQRKISANIDEKLSIVKKLHLILLDQAKMVETLSKSLLHQALNGEI